MKKLLACLFIAVFMVFAGGHAQAASLPDHPNSYVVDMTKTLSNAESKNLNEKLKSLHEGKKAEMFIVMVPSLEEQPIEDVTMSIAEKWKPGIEGKDNGLILFVAKNDHKMRLEIGRGLEGYITDGMAGEILDQLRKPFKKGNYEAGLSLAVDKTTTFLENPEAVQSETNDDSNYWILWAIFIVVIIVILLIIFIFFDDNFFSNGSSSSSSSGGFFSGSGSSGSFSSGGFFDGGGCSSDW